MFLETPLPTELSVSGPAHGEEVLRRVDRDPVEHDRGDHLVRSAVGLEPARDAGPDRAADACGDGRQDHAARSADMLRHDQRTHGSDPELARAADVEEPAAEREGDGEAGEHERREQHERRDEVVLGQERVDAERIAGDQVERPVEAGADDEILVDVERVRAREGHREAADDQREEDRQQREPELAHRRRPQGALDHAGTLPPVMATPSSRSSVDPLARSSAIWPPNMTRMRSARSMTSSSSNDTSRTAQPASRCSTRRRWTYSIAPTSSPRVGWAAISRRGLDWISRASTTFC